MGEDAPNNNKTPLDLRWTLQAHVFQGGYNESNINSTNKPGEVQYWVIVSSNSTSKPEIDPTKHYSEAFKGEIQSHVSLYVSWWEEAMKIFGEGLDDLHIYYSGSLHVGIKADM